ncbi:MAG: hypothetical protein ACR2P1_11830, partial [Pseudomonadales bacterium]
MATMLWPEIDFSLAPLPDLHTRLNALRDAGERVVTVNYNGEPAWLVLRYEDVAQIYTDEENLPGSAAYKRHSEPVMGRMMLAMDGDEHRINRLLVSKAFHP